MFWKAEDESLSATVVERWEPIEVDTILEENTAIYDSWDKDNRTPIQNLEELPLVDEETGKEIRIYREDGQKIARRFAIANTVAGACGVLVDLKTASALFEDPNETGELEEDDWMLDDEGEAEPKPKRIRNVSVYPQAFLRDYGHVQAKCGLNVTKPAIKAINSRFQEDPNIEDDEDDNNTNDGVEAVHLRPQPIVMAISAQMYNDILHRLTTHAGALDVQKGKLTAALAGSYASGTKHVKTAETLQRYCNIKFPHDRFKERIQHADLPRSLRIESVYSINMGQLSEDKRNGR